MKQSPVMMRRRLLRATGIAVGTAWIVRASSGFAATAPKASPLTIGLLRNPVSGLIAVTDENGWFKAAGVDVTSITFSGAGGPKLIQAMGGGSVGLGSVSATAALLALAANAVPLRIVSISTDPAPAFALLSAPEIRTMPELRGKRVATTAGTGLQYFLARALRKFGMTLGDVEFVNLPVGDAQSAFLAKRVDAVVPSLNGRYYIERLRKDTHVLFGHDDFTKPPGPTTRFEDYDVFVAPRSIVESNAPALRAFLAAYHGKGVPYLLDPSTQPAAIAEITRYVNAEQKSPTDEAAMRRQLLTSGFFDVAKARAILASDAFHAGLEDQIRFFVDTKRIPAPIPLDGVIVRDLVGG
ncbi:MAG TPA: ABC transporter substrate-binding protein [Casimicrobiaceae bacterium]|nr:ABC transporter substrate-binding protein [Casimicrobiaceae bacterium]